MIGYISAQKLPINFLGIDFWAAKPIISAELRVMMDEL